MLQRRNLVVTEPRVGSAIPKPCQDKNLDGQPCGAWALPGYKYCVGHKRARMVKSRADIRAEGPSAGLYDVELGPYNELVDGISQVVKAKNSVDDLSINRLAMTLIRARRLDIMAKNGNLGVIKAIYFNEQTIQNWLAKIGIDRRTVERVKAEREPHGKPKHNWLGGDNRGKPAAIELDRGTVDGDDAEGSSKGAHPERSSGVLPGDSRDGTSSDPGEVHPEQQPGANSGMG